jgi:dienelactone hydrolase
MNRSNARDVSFAGSAGDAVSARLLGTPNGSRAGMLFLHWGFGDRTSFEREAAAYVPGAVALCIDAPGFGARAGARVPARDARFVRAYAERLLGDLARGVDFLCAQPGVDAARIGLVGHSLGATIVPAFLAREPRVRAAVLMAGTSALSRLWLTTRNADGARSLEDLDAVRCLPRIRAALLFQFAQRDEFISRADAEAQIAAARGPKQATWYACDHALNAAAFGDRARWLGEQLGFAGEPGLPAHELLPRAQVRRYRLIAPVVRLASWLSRRA